MRTFVCLSIFGKQSILSVLQNSFSYKKDSRAIKRKFSVNDAKRNFDELLLSAQRELVKISKNNKDAVVVMSIKDYEELEAIKTDYQTHCFESAKRDLAQGEEVDGEDFLNTL